MPDLFSTHGAQEESVAFMALASADGVGYKTLYTIHRSGRPFAELLSSPSVSSTRAALSEAGVKNASSLAERICNDTKAMFDRGQAELHGLAERGIRLIHHFEPQFPRHLRAIKDPPGWLFVQGNPDVLAKPMIAIVGSRKAHDIGIFLTDCICFSLIGSGICTVSGLAEGIDREVHRASLFARLPTAAVLGTGINNHYPVSSTDLRNEIVAQGGCVVTEYLPNDTPTRTSFVWRNRIQAGLSRVTVPTQWQLKSGTARTVSFALDNGRPVVGVALPQQDTEEARFLRGREMRVFHLPNEAEEMREYLFRLLD